jgi:hypothetical protein
MTTPWTRPQKIAVWGVVVGAASAIAGFGLIFFETRKLNFEISKFNVAETQRVEEERRRLEEERRGRVIEWQKVVVYNILQARMLKPDRAPMTFEEIRLEYVTQATTVNGIDLKKEELQDLALKRILLDLMSYQLVYETSGSRYTINQHTVNAKFDRFFVQSDAGDRILNTIDNESGKYTPADLDAKLRDELKVTKEEFNHALLQLMGLNWIILDEKGKLWSRLKPPKDVLPTPRVGDASLN